jgi:hypothetical protein
LVGWFLVAHCENSATLSTRVETWQLWFQKYQKAEKDLAKEHSFLLKYTSLARIIACGLTLKDDGIAGLGGRRGQREIHPDVSQQTTKLFFLHKTQGHNTMGSAVTLQHQGSTDSMLTNFIQTAKPRLVTSFNPADGRLRNLD